MKPTVPIIKTPRSRWGALIDAVLTAFAWLAFFYLFAAGLKAVFIHRVPGLPVPLFSRLLPSLLTLLVYLVVAACIALSLYVWARYNALRFGRLDRRKSAPALSIGELATSFSVSPTDIHTAHDSAVVIVHHSDDGHVRLIETTFTTIEQRPVAPMERSA